MSKELLIIFVYDSEVRLSELDDPYKAVLYFHPTWVSSNQRMALCGQLIGVTQFLQASFAFPSIVSLKSGKFATKKIGRYILCVGTDHNIDDLILIKRIKTLHDILTFYHADLKNISSPDEVASIVQTYVPLVPNAANVFSNTTTLHLPKAATGVFLEATQILEYLQSQNGVYGGSIFYKNKVIVSQLDPNVTKQIIATDPCRQKIAARRLNVSVHTCVILFAVFLEQNYINRISEGKLPPMRSLSNKEMKRTFTKHDSRTCSLVLEETEPELQKECVSVVIEKIKEKNRKMATEMPDVVKDAVGWKECWKEVKPSSRIVHSLSHVFRSPSLTTDDLPNAVNSPTYYSLERLLMEEETEGRKNELWKCTRNFYYNTLSDSANAWYKSNGLPVSKTLKEERVSAVYSIVTGQQREIKKKSNEQSGNTILKKFQQRKSLERPTSISLSGAMGEKGSKKLRAKRVLEANMKANQSMERKNDQINDDKKYNKSRDKTNKEIEAPLTPLMAKLGVESLVLKEKDEEKKALKFPSKGKEMGNALKECALFVYGCNGENFSLTLLLSQEAAKKEELIELLERVCEDNLPDLEQELERTMEAIPQCGSFPCGESGITQDSYAYLSLHSAWDTLQRGGLWSSTHLESVCKMHENFQAIPSLTEITLRSDDCVIYGNQMGDNRVFYQQPVPCVAGLPMPSDLMGLAPLKAKRRLERDHSILLL